MGIYALGRLEFAELFPEETETVRRALIKAKTFLVYQRQLNNLSIQEGRLRKQRQKDTETLAKKQVHRKLQAVSRLNAQRARMRAAKQDRNSQDLRAGRLTPGPFCAIPPTKPPMPTSRP